MRLIHKATGVEVKLGDVVQTALGDITATVDYFSKPHKPSSEGKMTASTEEGHTIEYYCSVFGCKWIDREDRANV